MTNFKFLKIFRKNVVNFVISLLLNTDQKLSVHMRMDYCSSPMSASQMPSETIISLMLGNFVQKTTLDAKPSSVLVRRTYRNMLISLLVFHCFYSNRLLVRSISHLAVLRLVVALIVVSFILFMADTYAFALAFVFSNESAIIPGSNASISSSDIPD